MKIICSQFLSETILLLLGITLVIAFSILIFFLLPIFILRFILGKTSQFINPHLGKMVTARGQFLATENFTSGKPPRAAVVIALRLDGYITSDETRKLLMQNLIDKKISTNSNLPKYPELQQYVTTWLGFRFWKPVANFNINDYVREYQVNVKFFSEGDLRGVIENLINLPFQPNKSPWEVYIINDFNETNVFPNIKTIVIIRTHHCLADGYGIVHTFIDNVGGGLTPDVKPNFVTRSNVFQFMFILTFPFRMLYELSQFLVLPIINHPWKVPDEKKMWKQLYWMSPIIPISKVKAIKDTFEVSFSSVVHTAYAAASRASLVKRYGDKSGMQHVPCVAILPLPNHPKTLRNYCTGAFIKLPTGDCDPVTRLRLCELEVSGAKGSTMPFLGQFLPVIGGSLPIVIASLLGKNRSFPVGVSNFPISSSKLTLLGKQVLWVMSGAGGQAGVTGVNYLVYTYNEGIQFTVTAEGSLMSHQDLNELIQAVKDEVDCLYKLSETQSDHEEYIWP